MNTINREVLLQRIESFAQEKGKSLNTVFIESGAGKNFKSNMRTANPSLGKIALIANYLGTTSDYLLGKSEIKYPGDVPKGYVPQSFKSDFISTCYEKQVSPAEVCKAIGLPEDAYMKWTDDYYPDDDTLEKVAAYFKRPMSYYAEFFYDHVTKEYEDVHGIFHPESLTPNEIKVILAYRKHPELHAAIKRMLEIEDDEQNKKPSPYASIAAYGDGEIQVGKKKPKITE